MKLSKGTGIMAMRARLCISVTKHLTKPTSGKARLALAHCLYGSALGSAKHTAFFGSDLRPAIMAKGAHGTAGRSPSAGKKHRQQTGGNQCKIQHANTQPPASSGWATGPVNSAPSWVLFNPELVSIMPQPLHCWGKRLGRIYKIKQRPGCLVFHLRCVDSGGKCRRTHQNTWAKILAGALFVTADFCRLNRRHKKEVACYSQSATIRTIRGHQRIKGHYRSLTMKFQMCPSITQMTLLM